MDRTVKRSVIAPGKVVLVGEYAVVDGGPAVVMAIDRGVRCDVHDGSGIETPDGDVRFVAPAIGDARERERFVFSDWNPPDVGGSKPGLGGSAAACVAACIAVDRPATDAYEIHATVQGGGSGVDVAASVYGGILLFERRKVVGLSPLQPVVVYSGSGAATRPRLERYREWSDRPAFVRESRLAVYAFLDDPLAGMERDAALLDRMVASAGIDYWTRHLRAIVEAARACGGAAKPSGAGGGDCAVALFSSSADRAAFRERCAAEGFPIIDVRPAEAARRVADEG
jgi:phosphomevalonate kinase